MGFICDFSMFFNGYYKAHIWSLYWIWFFNTFISLSATSQKSDLYVSLVDFERGQLSSMANHQTILTMPVENNYKSVCQTHAGKVESVQAQITFLSSHKDLFSRCRVNGAFTRTASALCNVHHVSGFQRIPKS